MTPAQMTPFETFLMQYAALFGGLLLFAMLNKKPPAVRIPYALFATAGLLIALENQLHLSLGFAISAPYEVGISTLSNIALIEAALLLFFQMIAPPVGLANFSGRITMYVIKGGVMATLAGCATYLAVAMQADEKVSFLAASMFSVAVIQRLSTKPLFGVVTLAVCLSAFCALQQNYYFQGQLQDDVLRLSYVAAAAVIAVL